MMKMKFSTIIILLNINYMIGQQYIDGCVMDNINRQAISDVNIHIIETNQNFITSKDGYYRFKNLIPGNYHLKFSHLAFNDSVVFISIKTDENYTTNIYLVKNAEQISEVNITGMRQTKLTENIPARLDIIAQKELEMYPNSNIDNCLQSIANVYVNRSWGIFSKNSSVTMRGMDGTSRVLVLLNGTPLNFSAGGGINWHLIESEQVEKIEVLKGPASALYGNNAMGGVINILTKKNSQRFSGEINLFGGTYNTLGGELNIGSNYIKNNKGLYWSGNAFYRQGDGYVIVPESERDTMDTKLGLNELSLNLLSGYQINNRHKIDFGFQWFNDKRDEGIKIYEEDGSYLKYTTQNYQLSYTGKAGEIDVYLKSFYHLQNYYQHSERLNETGDSYKLYDRNQLSEDYGFWLNMVKKTGDKHEISFGSDFKHGSMLADDIYFTSTDYFKREGDINYYALFLQDEFTLLSEKMIISLGLRADLAEFQNGYLNVEDPTPVTSFESQSSQKFEETSWTNISPKIAAQYKFNPKLRIYTTLSAGFMPPTLDDMVSSRKVSKGFKIANPNLKPETLYNYEIGIDYKPNQSLKFETSTYYSIGNDFQYFAHTGDTVDIDKPVVMRDNVAKAIIYGIETSIDWKIFQNLSLKANYTYNHSQIVEFISKTNNPQDDLTNKFIAETPPHQAYFGLLFSNKFVNFNLITNYIGEMWADEYNSQKLEAYTTIDIRMQKNINQFDLALDIQNILDNQYIDKKNGLSPGRFIILKAGYNFVKIN